jgi:hypothetical protein
VKRRAALLALLGALATLAFFLAVHAFEAKLVYFPGPRPVATPADFGLAYRDVRLVTDDGVELAAWWIPGPEGARGAVCVSHGNAGSIEGRIPLAQVFHEQGFGVLLYDYRGYGASAGSPSEEGTYRDACAALDWLAREGRFAPERVVAYGESLGGCVAVELARRRRVGALFVEATFTSLPDLGARLYPYLPVRLLASIHYASLAKIAALEVPVLVAHSPEDEIVPYELGRALFEAAREPKRFLTTAGGHNAGGFTERQSWRDEVGAFLREALSP